MVPKGQVHWRAGRLRRLLRVGDQPGCREGRRAGAGSADHEGTLWGGPPGRRGHRASGLRQLYPTAGLLRRTGHVDQRRIWPHDYSRMVAAERRAFHVPGRVRGPPGPVHQRRGRRQRQHGQRLLHSQRVLRRGRRGQDVRHLQGHCGHATGRHQLLPGQRVQAGPGFSACLTDAQLRDELRAITASQKLPTSMANFYPVFLPPGVETEDVDGTNSANDYCGYHRSFGSGSDQTVYGDLPYPPSSGGCDTGQAPNGNLRADGEVSTFAHELMEAITDPLNPQYAWFDGKGNEIGDMCDENYGGALGSTSSADPSGTEYNQVINGHKYYVQEFFSNLAYHDSGVGKGCALSEALAENPKAAGTGTGATTIGYAFADAFPTELAANGKDTSSISVAVGDQHGYVVQGDRVHFSLGLEYGTGLCGKLSSHEALTDATGHATVTYTASKFSVQCWVVATEADGGRGAEAIIYQGKDAEFSPNLTASFPASVRPGRSATFTMTATNPSPHPLANAQVDLVVYPGDGTKQGVGANQLRLSYSMKGPVAISPPST